MASRVRVDLRWRVRWDHVNWSDITERVAHVRVSHGAGRGNPDRPTLKTGVGDVVILGELGDAQLSDRYHMHAFLVDPVTEAESDIWGGYIYGPTKVPGRVLQWRWRIQGHHSEREEQPLEITIPTRTFVSLMGDDDFWSGATGQTPIVVGGIPDRATIETTYSGRVGGFWSAMAAIGTYVVTEDHDGDIHFTNLVPTSEAVPDTTLWLHSGRMSVYGNVRTEQRADLLRNVLHARGRDIYRITDSVIQWGRRVLEVPGWWSEVSLVSEGRAALTALATLRLEHTVTVPLAQPTVAALRTVSDFDTGDYLFVDIRDPARGLNIRQTCIVMERTLEWSSRDPSTVTLRLLETGLTPPVETGRGSPLPPVLVRLVDATGQVTQPNEAVGSSLVVVGSIGDASGRVDLATGRGEPLVATVSLGVSPVPIEAVGSSLVVVSSVGISRGRVDLATGRGEPLSVDAGLADSEGEAAFPPAPDLRWEVEWDVAAEQDPTYRQDLVYVDAGSHARLGYRIASAPDNPAWSDWVSIEASFSQRFPFRRVFVAVVHPPDTDRYFLLQYRIETDGGLPLTQVGTLEILDSRGRGNSVSATVGLGDGQGSTSLLDHLTVDGFPIRLGGSEIAVEGLIVAGTVFVRVGLGEARQLTSRARIAGTAIFAATRLGDGQGALGFAESRGTSVSATVGLASGRGNASLPPAPDLRWLVQWNIQTGRGGDLFYLEAPSRNAVMSWRRAADPANPVWTEWVEISVTFPSVFGEVWLIFLPSDPDRDFLFQFRLGPVDDPTTQVGTIEVSGFKGLARALVAFAHVGSAPPAGTALTAVARLGGGRGVVPLDGRGEAVDVEVLLGDAQGSSRSPTRRGGTAISASSSLSDSTGRVSLETGQGQPVLVSANLADSTGRAVGQTVGVELDSYGITLDGSPLGLDSP